ncbi:MAG: HAD-IA family hydrolase [Pseudomonadota bacterium]
MIKALLLGSIGVVSETSEIQRQSYNAAFREVGLAWDWDAETYKELLVAVGGKERLSLLSRATTGQLDAETIDTIHTRKTEIACDRVLKEKPPLRHGVAPLLRYTKKHGLKSGFVTSTYRPNIDAIINAHTDVFDHYPFDVVISKTDVAAGKPAPDCYVEALRQLDLEPSEVVAVEDTAASAVAASRAGLKVIATPGAFAAGQDFFMADLVVPALGNDTRVADDVMAFLAAMR